MKNTEVERRFLVYGSEWERLGEGEDLCQGYLNTDPDCTVRVRLEGIRGYFTVKGKKKGNRRTEIEAEIPSAQAKSILQHPDGFCQGNPVMKRRYKIKDGDVEWEVDKFQGDNEGLAIAEVEYHGDKAGIEAWECQADASKPVWVGEEISGDVRYHNSRLALRPFSTWTEEEREPMMRHSRSGHGSSPKARGQKEED